MTRLSEIAPNAHIHFSGITQEFLFCAVRNNVGQTKYRFVRRVNGSKKGTNALLCSGERQVSTQEEFALVRCQVGDQSLLFSKGNLSVFCHDQRGKQ